MNWNDGLTGEHLAIAASAHPRIGILAGPGTGKTSMGLMRRVARLLSEGVPGQQILLLSFTRTAAADLRDKVSDLGTPGIENVEAMTLHSFCFRLLRQQSVLTATQRIPRMILKHESDLMLRDIQGEFGNIYKKRDMLEAYEAGWVRETTDHPGLSAIPTDRVFESEIIKWLRHHKGMLIGEVVPIAYQYLRDNPSSNELEKYKHIIVDEYQDLNHLEQHLLELMASKPGVNICIAGDDDQSIYGFRYANPVGILDFVNDSRTERRQISVSRRCPKLIMSISNSLISNAPRRNKPILTTNHTEDGNISVIQWNSLDEEIEGIVSAIAADITNERRTPGEILVLTPRSKIGTEIRKKLQEIGIPSQSYFNEESVANENAREALAYLQLLCGNDLIARRVLLGSNESTGHSSSYVKLLKYAADNNLSEVDVLEQLVNGVKIPGLLIPSLTQLHTKIMARIAQLVSLSPEQVVNELFPEGLDELKDIRRIAVDLLPDSPTLDELLKKMVAIITQMDVPPNPNWVRIMSLHKSKGLTSPVVIIVGFNEGIIPSINPDISESQRSQAIEEQRRLVYVALTRSSDQLIISSSTSLEVKLAKKLKVVTIAGSERNIAGKLIARTIASSYLRELGPSLPASKRGIDWIATY